MMRLFALVALPVGVAIAVIIAIVIVINSRK